MNEHFTALEEFYDLKKSELEALSKINMNDVHHYWDNLATFNLKIKELETRREKLIDSFCDKCPHPQEFLVESPYRESTFFDFLPWRLCKLCGAAEKGWSYEFVKPKIVTKYVTCGELPQVTMDDLNKLRTKIYDKEE